MMLLEYFARLALLLPLLGGLIWGSLKLTRYLQTRMVGQMGAAGRHLELVETSLIAPGMRLAVVRFHDREILLGASRQGLVRLGEAPARAAESAQ
ncbi:flagellar biosynthetic protein FliO [Erythrobacter sp. T5W1-R]|uniref:flagellar biosynthetic protein FliO n=1 Tax=Erythrobacter sp. T5W1-R TaxID=3101752 RepID=UPI002AFFDE62|nr:flagellar biosynthetic protein FliO [Erythrobacter sp. T5W1-R]MEA1618998.1 flagellar biosynthetic protein FliO [Erythrobacter sp. T5W1-R]